MEDSVDLLTSIEVDTYPNQTSNGASYYPTSSTLLGQNSPAETGMNENIVSPEREVSGDGDRFPAERSAEREAEDCRGCVLDVKDRGREGR